MLRIWLFFKGSVNLREKLCVSWALPFVECVAVWALKLPVPHTDVLKPTNRKAFLPNYWNPKKSAAPPLSQASQLLLDFGSELIWNMQMLVWRFWDNLFALILPKGLHFHLIIWHYSDKLHVNCNSFWYFLFLWLFFFDFHTTFMQLFWIFIEDNVA